MLSRQRIKTCYVRFRGLGASTNNAQCLERGLGTIAQDLENPSLPQYKPSAPCWAWRKDSPFLSSKMQPVPSMPLWGCREGRAFTPPTCSIQWQQSVREAGESQHWVTGSSSGCRQHAALLTLVEMRESVPREDNINHEPLESFLSLFKNRPLFIPAGLLVLHFT